MCVTHIYIYLYYSWKGVRMYKVIHSLCNNTQPTHLATDALQGTKLGVKLPKDWRPGRFESGFPKIIKVWYILWLAGSSAISCNLRNQQYFSG